VRSEDSQYFSGHPYIGRIARSSLRELSCLVFIQFGLAAIFIVFIHFSFFCTFLVLVFFLGNELLIFFVLVFVHETNEIV